VSIAVREREAARKGRKITKVHQDGPSWLDQVGPGYLDNSIPVYLDTRIPEYLDTWFLTG